MKKGLSRIFAIAALTGAGLLGIGAGGAAINYQLEIQAPAGIHCTAPKGDGHPVLIIPGWTVDDDYMQPLAARIRDEGYKVYGWDNGYNLGPDAAKASHLETQLKKAYADNGNRKVTLIGYSLGGIYARELSRKYPQLVRDVITLSSPIGMKDKHIDAIRGFFSADKGASTDALTVPTTALFSNHDWIVKARDAEVIPSATAENIEVRPGHFALPFSAEGQGIILNRLAQGAPWQPMDKAACRYTVPRSP